MTDLAQTTALGGDAPKRLTAGALTLAECPDVAIASVARLRGAPVPAPAPALPLPSLPGPGGYAEGPRASAFWVAPDQWMVLAEGRAEEDLARRLATQLQGAVVTEQTDGFVVLDVTSSEGAAPIERLLEKLVNLDPAELGPGRATRSALHHMAVFVVRPEPGRLRLLGMRSSAGSLWHGVARALRFQAVAARRT